MVQLLSIVEALDEPDEPALMPTVQPSGEPVWRDDDGDNRVLVWTDGLRIERDGKKVYEDIALKASLTITDSRLVMVSAQFDRGGGWGGGPDGLHDDGGRGMSRARRIVQGAVTAGLAAVLTAGCSGDGGGLSYSSKCEDYIGATPQEQLRFAQDVVNEKKPKNFVGRRETTSEVAGNLSYNCANSLDTSLEKMVASITK